MRQSLELKLGQRLSMTPQLQQAIRLLQLSAIDLQLEIQQALEENPLLEEEDTRVEEPGNTAADDTLSVGTNDTPADDRESESAVDVDFPDWADEFDPIYTTGQRSGTDDNGAYEIDHRNSAPTTLRDHLYWQMRMTPFSEHDRKVAMAIIDAINEDGYLSCSMEEIDDTLRGELECEPEEIEATLHQIQNFDPVGVGARDLQECLLLQLRHYDPDLPGLDKARDLVANHLALLANRDYTQLQRVLKLDEAALREIIKIVQALHPRPGSAIAPIQPSYITPDVIVKKVKGEWVAELNPEAFPRLHINRTYQSLVRRGDNSEQNRYIQDQLQEARWFIKSLRNRNDTLLRVARAIIERQQEFLDVGEEAMKPMVLHDIAETLEMHESTISRATTQKYMLTPRGIFELKYFFSSHVSTADGGTCSSTAIRSLIKKFVETEPPSKPISDSKIAKLLAEHGINVARRTVAKYRENMNIPPSNQRKSLL